VRQPFIFKLTQQHTNNWEVGILFTQCTIFPHVNVPPLGYGQIYNIFSNDKHYDVTNGNFLGCSCVYFVTTSVTSLAAVGCICNVNMCIMSYNQLCSMGS